MSLSALYEAAFIYQQLSGIDAIIAWHERELVRLKASRATIDGSRGEVTQPDATVDDAATADLRRKLEIANDALDFYADPMRWIEPRGGKPTAAGKDKGDVARQALAEMDDNDGNGAAE